MTVEAPVREEATLELPEIEVAEPVACQPMSGEALVLWEETCPAQARLRWTWEIGPGVKVYVDRCRVRWMGKEWYFHVTSEGWWRGPGELEVYGDLTRLTR